MTRFMGHWPALPCAGTGRRCTLGVASPSVVPSTDLGGCQMIAEAKHLPRDAGSL